MRTYKCAHSNDTIPSLKELITYKSHVMRWMGGWIIVINYMKL